MRDATDYYNLLSDTLKNGSNQIKYLYNKIENAKSEGKYINVRTGGLIQEKDSYNNNYFFNYNEDFPLCYNFSCCGLARRKVIKKMMDFYLSCLKEFDISQDEELMKEKIKNEIEMAKNDYEYLNKNNNGYDDLKLFKTIPHPGEEKDSEPSINSSSFINDDSLEEDDNSFIDDKSLSEEKEKEKKHRLRKNGKNVVNEYKKELDDLLEENYDGEEDLNQEENENSEEDNGENNEESEEENLLNINTKVSSSKKKKKLCKSKLLNKKTKRNIIDDSDEEEEKDSNSKKEEIKEEDVKNILKKYNDIVKEKEENKKEKKYENLADKEYFNNLKENLKLKQGTLDAFLSL